MPPGKRSREGLQDGTVATSGEKEKGSRRSVSADLIAKYLPDRQAPGQCLYSPAVDKARSPPFADRNQDGRTEERKG